MKKILIITSFLLMGICTSMRAMDSREESRSTISDAVSSLGSSDGGRDDEVGGLDTSTSVSSVGSRESSPPRSPLARFSPIEASPPVLVGLLGAPAAGKSYSFKQLGEWGVEYFSRYAPGQQPFENLTVDILRGEILDLPPVMQLYFFLESYEWFRVHATALVKKSQIAPLSEEDQEALQTFTTWQNDVRRLVQGMDQLLNKQYRTIYPSVLSLPEEEVLLRERLAQEGFIDSGLYRPGRPRVYPKGNSLYFELDGRETTRAKFISKLDQDNIPQAFVAIMKTYNSQYDTFKRIVRFHQDYKLRQASLTRHNVFLDETGGNPQQLARVFNYFRQERYINILVMIHHKSIMVNLMQNAYRMVVGSDGGRDSSSSIVDAYQEIEGALPAYRRLTRAGGFHVVERLEDIETVKAYLNSSAVQDLPETIEEAIKPVNAFIQMSNSDVGDTLRRTMTKLAEPDKQALFYSLLLLHRDNPKKGGKLWRPVYGTVAVDEDARARLMSIRIPVSEGEALARIRAAVASKEYEGINAATLREAEEVFGRGGTAGEDPGVSPVGVVSGDASSM